MDIDFWLRLLSYISADFIQLRFHGWIVGTIEGDVVNPASTICNLTLMLLASARNGIGLGLDSQCRYGIEAYQMIGACRVIKCM